MAVGFPAKTTYVNGDVFSASDINDTNGTLNLVNPATTGTVQSNPILNSALQIWQRGTSIAVTSGTAQVYTADRWWYANAASGMSGTVSRQATSDTTNLPFIQYCARVQRTAGNTNTTNQYFAQDIETINSIPFAGKTITVSWYARKGANYSPASSFFSYQVRSGTGTDQSMYTGYTGSTNLANANVTLTTTWQRFTTTVAVGSTATQLGLFFFTNPSGTAGAADYFEITGVQIDIGSASLPFRTNQPTYATEFAACQRYYQFIGGTNGGYPADSGYLFSGNSSATPITFPVQMRIAPAITKNGTWNVVNCGQPSATSINNQGFSMSVTSSSTGGYIVNPNSTDDTFTMNAEM
jgi:hypothetical protein